MSSVPPGDSAAKALASLERAGKTALLVGIPLAIYFFIVGYCYWSGYLSPYNLEPWSLGIPFLRFLVPDGATFTLMAGGVIAFMILARLFKQVHMELPPAETLEFARAQTGGNPVVILSRLQALKKSAKGVEILEALDGHPGLEKEGPLFRLTEAKLANLSMGEFIEKLTSKALLEKETGLPEGDASILGMDAKAMLANLMPTARVEGLIEALSNEEFKGLRALIVLYRNVVVSGAPPPKLAVLLGKFTNPAPSKPAPDAPRAPIDRTVAGASGLFGVWVLYRLISDPASVLAIALGAGLGVGLRFLFKKTWSLGPRLGGASVALVIVLVYASLQGGYDGRTNPQDVTLVMTGEEEERYGRKVLETEKWFVFIGDGAKVERLSTAAIKSVLPGTPVRRAPPPKVAAVLPVPVAPPALPPVTAENRSQEWWAIWRQHRRRLEVDDWVAGDGSLPQKAARHLDRMQTDAPEWAPDVIDWFGGQVQVAANRVRDISGGVKTRQDLGARYLGWCDAILAVCKEIDGLNQVTHSVRQVRAEAEAFATYRGTFTLKVFVVPYAQVTRILRDGEQLPVPAATTPFVVANLVIGEYEVELSHPDMGKANVKIAADQLKDGRTYLVHGTVQGQSFRVKEVQ